MEKMVVRTDPYGFGIIVPMETGIIFEHQCDGYLCNQVQQEGIFIPLKEGYFSYEINDLGDKEYYYDEKKLPFIFELILENFDNLTTDQKISKMRALMFQEAREWIIFLGWKDKSDPETKNWDKLIGKKVLLIYRNSD